MSNFSINRPPDVITVLWQRNPLIDRGPRIIITGTVIGSAEPCPNLLSRGERYRRAAECLIDNGFTVEYEESFDSIGVSVLIREY